MTEMVTSGSMSGEGKRSDGPLGEGVYERRRSLSEPPALYTTAPLLDSTLVWITKYRYKVLRGEVAERARDLLREICAAREVRILRGAVSPDHIHMLVVAPPQLAPAKLVQFLKGRSSRMLQRDFPHLRKRYWGQHLWARGYFCATVGAVDEKTVMQYIESQKWDQDDEGFKVTAPSEP